MARLNEPSAPVETIDALKRRFIRQNREIARVNSTQSLRIRTLESEISHLLTENIALRQHIIHLQHEIDRYPGGMRLDDMRGIKEKMEAKLTEIGGLVQELGKIQSDATNRRSPKRKPIYSSSPKRSPDQKAWKNVLSLAEVTGAADGRLPPIVEDKYFPRKTLDAEEFLGMFPDAANTMDSPELGPPPIAHFEDGDPTKPDPTRDDVHSTKPLISEDDMQPAMFANLETRKRRRETTNLRKTVSLPMDSHDVENPDATEQPTLTRKSLKSGAKRKLDVAADEDRGPGKDSEDDGFEFGRSRADPDLNKSLRPGPLRGETSGSEKCLQGPGAELTHANVREASAAISKSRKALGPKSNNMDPTSPSKVRKLGVNNKIGDSKDRLPKRILDGPRLKEKPRNALFDEPKHLDVPNLDKMTPELEKGRPETPTPAPGEAFIPDVPEPSSEIRSDSKDNLTLDVDPDSSSTKAFDLAERATRRPRGSVSYAEPNLRAKMRRPNKDLADAVKPGEHSKHAIMIPDGETPCQIDTPAEKGVLRTVIVKKEIFADPSNPWQVPSSMDDHNRLNRFESEATSPLENKASAQLVNELVDSIQEEQIPAGKQSEIKASGAGSAIAALSAGRPKSRKRDEDEGVREIVDARRDTLDLGATDTPADDPGEGKEEIVSVGSKRETDGVNSTIRSHRRHSSIPKEDAKVGDGRPALAVSMTKRRERKRESLITSAHEVHTGTEMRSARSVGRLQAGGGGVVDGGVGRAERAERAASRRRSMML